MAEHLVLIGMMGAGKTAVGRILAERLGRCHLDTDEMVCAATGMTVAEIFATAGEGAFRAGEAAAVSAAVAVVEPGVISVGGGALGDPATRRLLGASGRVVWLRADPATLAARLGSGDGRPLLTGIEASDQPSNQLAGAGASAQPPIEAPLDVLRRLDDERRPTYAGAAEVTVDVDGVSILECAEAVLAALGMMARTR